MNDLFRLKKCFKELEQQNPGFAARLNFMCCGSCGHAAMSNHGNGLTQWIFIHEQGMESCFGEGYGPAGTSNEDDGLENDLPMHGTLYMQHHFTSEPLKRIVVDSLRQAGFKVHWDYSQLKCIEVKAY